MKPRKTYWEHLHWLSQQQATYRNKFRWIKQRL